MRFFFFFWVWWGLVLEVVRMGVEAGEPMLLTIWRVWFIFYFFSPWSLSHVRLFETPWTIAWQSPLVHGIFQARILEWVAIPFCKGSSWPRDRTWVSWIGRRIFFFTSWATREAPWFVCILTDIVRSPQRNRKLNDHLHELLSLWLNFWISTLHSKFIVS